MYFIYSLIYAIVIFFLLPFEYFKRPGDLRTRWLREKFGLLDLEPRASKPPGRTLDQSGSVWVHAVSVGEVIAAAPLLKRIRERYPAKGIILSTITDTGQKVASERAPAGTKIVYLPFDVPLVLNPVLRRANPCLLIVIETELWPNMFRLFGAHRIPVILMNGRISEKSFRGYQKISFFMKRVLSNVDFFGMQNDEYAGRIISLGVDRARVKTLGNFKFDSGPSSRPPEWAAKIKGPVITAGSTHEGEEELMASLYLALKKDFPNLNVIIAPRHPERFRSVADMLCARGVPFVKRSDFEHGNGSSSIEGQLILLDSVGELSSVYGMSDIAVIGKSFRGAGGQNPLEPAYWGRPVICGPHMENFPVIQDFYEEGAAIEVNEEGLYVQLKELLVSPDRAKEIGSRAQKLYRRNSGAVEKAMEVIARYIS